MMASSVQPPPNLRFNQSEIQAIADALGDTNLGLTGSEIAHLLNVCRIRDCDPGLTKRFRLLNAFVESQNTHGHRRRILEFIRQAMKPAFHARAPERFEPLRANLNMALAFCGLAVEASGSLIKAQPVETLQQAARRARELREDLIARNVHPDVLACCKEEWLADDYFHVILEATKSINLKIQDRTGLTIDGAELVDRAFGGERPMLAINGMKSVGERSEQKGFVNLLKGIFGLFRTPTAHEARIRWAVEKRDAEEVLTLLSLAHRRIDEAKILIRT